MIINNNNDNTNINYIYMFLIVVIYIVQVFLCLSSSGHADLPACWKYLPVCGSVSCPESRSCWTSLEMGRDGETLFRKKREIEKHDNMM